LFCWIGNAKDSDRLAIQVARPATIGLGALWQILVGNHPKTDPAIAIEPLLVVVTDPLARGVASRRSCFLPFDLLDPPASVGATILRPKSADAHD
jgi:hypothetical protein